MLNTILFDPLEAVIKRHSGLTGIKKDNGINPFPINKPCMKGSHISKGSTRSDGKFLFTGIVFLLQYFEYR